MSTYFLFYTCNTCYSMRCCCPQF